MQVGGRCWRRVMVLPKDGLWELHFQRLTTLAAQSLVTNQVATFLWKLPAMLMKILIRKTCMCAFPNEVAITCQTWLQAVGFRYQMKPRPCSHQGGSLVQMDNLTGIYKTVCQFCQEALVTLGTQRGRESNLGQRDLEELAGGAYGGAKSLKNVFFFLIEM